MPKGIHLKRAGQPVKKRGRPRGASFCNRSRHIVTEKPEKYLKFHNHLQHLRIRDLFSDFFVQWLNGREYTENIPPPLYTIKPFNELWKLPNGEVIELPSLEKAYLSYEHLPGYEYDFVKEYFYNWDHWLKVSSFPMMRKYIEMWRRDKNIQIRHFAMNSLIQTVKGNPDSPLGLQAAKFLAARGHEGNVKPLKQTTREKAKIRQEEQTLEEDLEKLRGLKLVR